MLAQEDLWVYEALLNVIRNTNNCAPDKEKSYKAPATHKEAPIKRIESLEIGSDATQSWAASENSVFVFSGGESSGGSGAISTTPVSPGMSMGMRPSQPSYIQSQATSGGSAATSLLAGRYVGNDGKPLANPHEQPNQEFRMMPINLRVVMEQKAIPRLLVECANSNMRIDVRAVRILAEKPPAFDVNGNSTGSETAAPGAAAMPGPQMGIAPSMGGRRSGGGPMGHGGMGRGLPRGPTQNSSPIDGEEAADPTAPPVPVEIQGIIYIYNPPAPPTANGAATPGTPAAGTASGPATPPAGLPAPGTPAATPPGPAAPTTPTTPAPAPGTVPAAPGTAPPAGNTRPR
jgi:hypothetical protein